MGAQLERIHTLHGSPPPALPAPVLPSPPPPSPPPGITNTVQAPAPASSKGLVKDDALLTLAQQRVSEAGLTMAEAGELAMGLARFNLKPQRGLVAITFGDEKMGEHLLNWVWHLRGTRIPHIVVRSRTWMHDARMRKHHNSCVPRAGVETLTQVSGAIASQGALDEGMLRLLEENGVPSYPFFHKGLDGSNQHSSDSWKKFATGRMSQARPPISLKAPGIAGLSL
jgi:hypothetical protein